ncbi:MAG TPA: PQQ-binding-like beta-propeller repeat protein [Bryobacteraceae bacterium]|nr:PQQ-binding-like beta-propeller repeat protein [Bryobacteraceae bacterium]
MSKSVVTLALACATLCAENWPGFRGAGARGIADGTNLPTSWDAESGKNIAWKTAIPGLGLSSPVVWENTIYLTTAVSSNPEMVFESKLKGERDDRQDKAEQEFRVIALDKRTGRILWNQLAHKSKPRVIRHPHNSYASPTIATDGKHVIAFFGSEGLYCYNTKGKPIWKQDLGRLDQGAFDVPDYQWGTATSPSLWRQKVYVQADMHAGSFIAAFDAKTGKQLWRTARASKPSWSTPTVIEGPSRAELVTNGVEHIIGYDPDSGRELWRLQGTSMISVPTPFTAHGLIYVFSGYYRNYRRAYAIRPGAMGDITGSKESMAWMREESPYLSTPAVAGDYIFAFGSRAAGILNVYNAHTGATVYQRRLGQGTGASASVIAAGDHVYATNEDGEVYVLKAGPTYEEIAVNRMGEPVLATPAASGDMLFIRGAAHLFAIRNK